MTSEVGQQNATSLCASLSPCLQYGILFGSKKPDNVDQAYILLLSNLIEEGAVQCIVESLDLATGNIAVMMSQKWGSVIGSITSLKAGEGGEEGGEGKRSFMGKLVLRNFGPPIPKTCQRFHIPHT